MASIFSFFPMIIRQVGVQRLARKPEPKGVTDTSDNVTQYDEAMTTKLVLAYAAGLEIVHRAHSEETDSAVDMACGPGHYTICLARYLGYKNVIGIDLSQAMISVATRNADRSGMANTAIFQVGDVTKIAQLKHTPFNLTSFTDAAHHLPDLATVAHVVHQMETITEASGLVMIMDLARLRTARLTERYIEALGKDYVNRGLTAFYEDFKNSMYAVWTPKELRTVIPLHSRRHWVHIVPRGLPTMQIILGLPLGRKTAYVREGWRASEHPVIRDWYPLWQNKVGTVWAQQTLREWKLMHLTLRTASMCCLPPSR